MNAADRNPSPPPASSPAVKLQTASLLLTVPEAAARLGLKPSTLRCWILSRRCEVVRIGRAVRIPAIWIESYIARHTTPALPEGR